MIGVAILVVGALTAVSCSKTADTTAVESTPARTRHVAPTTTIVMAATTTTTSAPPTTAATVPADRTGALSAVVAAIAADPSVAAQLAQLDQARIASTLSVDPALLQLLQLSPAQLSQLAQGIAAGQAAARAAESDPAALLALLMRSMDAESLLNGTIATIVQSLLAAISGTDIVVSPEITVDMGEVLGDLDPDGMGPIVANPSNASLLALLTSAWLSENPLFAEQFLADPALDPGLRSLLVNLQSLTATIGETAQTALIDALRKLFPALPPPG